MSELTNPPAFGERNAIYGYRKQYQVSAFLILQALRSDLLTKIRVADPTAGRVDDFLLFKGQNIDAYQDKSQRGGGHIGFNDLKKPLENAPCLLGQLADGWKRIKKQNPRHSITVHLLTNQIPSARDHIPVGNNPPVHASLKKFLGEVWDPIKSRRITLDAIPLEWIRTWEIFRESTALSQEDFNKFIFELEFNFGFQIPDFSLLGPEDASILSRDLDTLQNEILNVVGGEEEIIELSREELLRRLRWKYRLEFTSRHKFSPPDIPYIQNQQIVSTIAAHIDNLPGGYVALIGPPGSGKSTLLSQAFRDQTQWRIVHYYAYVPSSIDPVSLRGESINFFHDIILAIERQGPQFRIGMSLSAKERSQLQTRFHEQLQKLSQDWIQNQKKTLLIIDGLDHISREAHPERSFLKDLPLPDQVPNGVYIILGSQTVQLPDLPPLIQHKIMQPDRIVEMKPLDQNSIFKILELTNLAPILNPDLKALIARISGGLPLILVYILHQIQECSTEEEIGNILNQSIQYGGNIESYYFSIWQQIEADASLTQLLGEVARLRGFISLDWIQTWEGFARPQQLLKKVHHLFQQEPHSRWRFFHNSFRQHLINKTAEGLNSIFDSNIDRQIYLRLAQHCTQSNANTIWRYDELYYRLMAHDNVNATKIATQDYFRQQLLRSQSIKTILLDITLALRQAIRSKNVIAMVRLILSKTEFEQREYNLEKPPLIRLLLGLGEYINAMDNILDGEALKISPGEALSVCVDLINADLFEFARKVFDQTEPWPLFSGEEELETQTNSANFKWLKSWAEVTPYFRKIGDIPNFTGLFKNKIFLC